MPPEVTTARNDRPRIIARGYSVLMGLGAVSVGVVAAMLTLFFGIDGKFLSLMGGLAAATLVLAVFIWRQHTWAMVAGVVFAVALKLAFNDAGPVLDPALILFAVACAALTAAHLAISRGAGDGNAG